MFVVFSITSVQPCRVCACVCDYCTTIALSTSFLRLQFHFLDDNAVNFQCGEVDKEQYDGNETDAKYYVEP